MISAKVGGNFNKIEQFLKKAVRPYWTKDLDKHGAAGVEALSIATPKDTGKTANSWTYEVRKDENGQVWLTWMNTNVVNGVNIAALIQTGHATGGGGYVPPVDYINPALKFIMDDTANEVWKGVGGT